MKKNIITILAIFVILAGIIALLAQKTDMNFNSQETPVPSSNQNLDEVWIKHQNEKSNLIKVSAPRIFEEISSPITVKGEARGYWYFEASFPVYVVDENREELAVLPVHAIGEWMTTDFVPFETEVSFKTPKSKTGFIIFKKDNPSGLPEHDDELRIPVKFK